MGWKWICVGLMFTAPATFASTPSTDETAIILRETSKRFNDHFDDNAGQGTLPAFLETFQRNVGPSTFRTYGDLVFQIYSSASTHEKYARQRQLIALCTEHQNITPHTASIALYNAFLPQASPSATHVIDPYLSAPRIQGGLLFGWLCEPSPPQPTMPLTFYVCDSTSGHALWSKTHVTTPNATYPAYTFDETSVYLANNGQVDIYASKTGVLRRTLRGYLDGSLKILALHVTTDAHLFIAYDAPAKKPELLEIDLTTDIKGMTWALQTPCTPLPFIATETTFPVTSGDHMLTLYTRARPPKTFPFMQKTGPEDAPTPPSFPCHGAIINDRLLLSQRIDGRTRLLCHNLVNDVEDWVLPLATDLCLHPVFTPQKDRVFLACKEGVILAISCRPTHPDDSLLTRLWSNIVTPEPGQIIWKKRLGNEIRSFLPSQDGSILYVLDATGVLYTFDTSIGLVTETKRALDGSGHFLETFSSSGKLYLVREKTF